MKLLTENTHKGEPIANKPRMRRFVLLLLSVLMCVIHCGTQVACAQARVNALDGEALALHSFAELSVTKITVHTGTHAADLALPSILTGYVAVEIEAPEETEEAEGETQETVRLDEIEVPVTWVCESYDSETPGTYLFVSQLMERFSYSEEMPTISVKVVAAEDEPSVEPEETTPEPEEATPEPEETTPEPEGFVTLDDAVLILPETEALVPEAYQIMAFTNDPIAIEVPRGTKIEDLPLPSSLPAINALGEEIAVLVTWENISASEEMEYDPNDYVTGSAYGYGPWIFTAKLAQPQIITPEATDGAEETPAAGMYAYIYEGEPVTASVTLPDCLTVRNVGGYEAGSIIFSFVVFKGDSLKLPSQISANMTDGGIKNVPVSWSGSYDADMVGEYQLSMSVGSNYSGFSAKAIVSVIRNFALGEE